MLLPIDSSSSKAKFKAIREPASADYTLGQDTILDPLPSREVNHGETQADTLVFEFIDQALNWKTMTISISSDGQSEYLERKDAKKVPINIADHFSVANEIAERRSQEMLAGGATVKLSLSRWARTLLPGDTLQVYDFEEILRVLSVKFNPDKGKVSVTCIPTTMGLPCPPSCLPGRGRGRPQPDSGRPVPDRGDPRGAPCGSSDTAITIARIRAHNQINSSAIHLSDDNSTYDLLGSQVLYNAGGTLTEALADDTLHIIDEGPTFTPVGPDISEVLDLSASLDSWRAGRQKVVINGELFFLQKVTAMPGSGGEYRLDGLMRARYDTRKQAHSVGDTVFILFDKSLRLFTDPIFTPGNEVFAKVQPTGPTGTLPLGQVVADSETLYGKGKVPPAPENLRLTAPFPLVKAFQTGQDLTFTWTWYSNSGAGFRNFGDPKPTRQWRIRFS